MLWGQFCAVNTITVNIYLDMLKFLSFHTIYAIDQEEHGENLFQHDDIPANFNHELRNAWNVKSTRWTGSGEPTPRPSRSPDFLTMGFFFCADMYKSIFYSQKIHIYVLCERIGPLIVAATLEILQRSWQEPKYLAHVCKGKVIPLQARCGPEGG